jgi:hypothetical protein
MIGIDLKSVLKSRKQATTLIETNPRAHKNKSCSKNRNIFDTIHEVNKRKQTSGFGTDKRSNNDLIIKNYQQSLESRPSETVEYSIINVAKFSILSTTKAQIDPHSEMFLLKTINVLKEYIKSQDKVHMTEIKNLKSKIESLKEDLELHQAKSITLLKENSNLKSKTLDMILNLRTYDMETLSIEKEYKVRLY